MLSGLDDMEMDAADSRPTEYRPISHKMPIPSTSNKWSNSKMKEYKVFNDSIHGHIELHPLCVEIMDTPQFQRLRYIRQLGGTYLVFAGASHNRFEHSLGVCHLAGEMVKSIQDAQPELGITERDKLCVEVAGLCHDLGHGPFSHLFDSLFIPAARPNLKWAHEDCSVAMFDHLLDENRIDLTAHGLDPKVDRDFIKELIVGPLDGEAYKARTGKKNCLYEIVANKNTGIDVDKWDYFARDCHGLGIKSMFDHTRLMKFTRVIKNDDVPGEKWNICFRDKEISNVYDMFHTRQILHRRAYQHKTAIGIEKMISDAFLAADPYIKVPGSGGKTFRISECIHDMTAYTRLNDTIFHRILCSHEPELAKARTILERIETRQLYRCVGQTKPKRGHFMPKGQIGAAETEIANKDPSLSREDIFLRVINFDYGMNDRDPVNGVRFYSKHNMNKATQITRSQVSHMLPEEFCDQAIRCYCRSLDEDVIETSRKSFLLWCRDNERVDTLEFENGYKNIA